MKYYLSGIAGTGMNTIAQYLVSAGNEVIGSDRIFDKGHEQDYIRDFLIEKGVKIVPQDGKVLDSSFSQCIFSAAVESDIPDYKAAQGLKLPVMSRSLFLKYIFNSHDSIGIAGTSGKTTTTGMLATVLIENNRKPTVFCGAEILNYTANDLGGNYFAGKSRLLLAEVDESDKVIDQYRPRIAVVTNISEDHMPVPEAERLFISFMSNSGIIVYNKDCPVLSALVSGMDAHTFSFSIRDQGADLCAEDIRTDYQGSSFRIKNIDFRIQIPGSYNIENAAAAVSAACVLGIPLEKIVSSLRQFQGIKGRFEKIPGKCPFTIIYDFAHNPAKISSLLETAVSFFPKIIFFYQPHGFGPFKKQYPLLADVFQKFLRPQDVLILGKIYDAGGTATRDVSSEVLVSSLAKKPFSSFYAETREEAEKIIKSNAGKTDACFVAGARDRTLRDFAFSLSK
jgi:UDP-N-acetylmuramate--alanine ligase